jgi:hypothetical protein
MKRLVSRGWATVAAYVTAVLIGVLAAGCIRSRILITSQPSGAEVYWHGEPYGTTPVNIPFAWYWHHDIALEKPGYNRLETIERLRTPPWFLMPTDLVMELIPVPIPDQRQRHYVLEPTEAAEPNRP